MQTVLRTVAGTEIAAEPVCDGNGIVFVPYGADTQKPPRLPFDGSPLRCVCVEVCCVERCSNVAVPALP